MNQNEVYERVIKIIQPFTKNADALKGQPPAPASSKTWASTPHAWSTSFSRLKTSSESKSTTHPPTASAPWAMPSR